MSCIKVNAPKDSHTDFRVLDHVAAELMKKYLKQDKAVGVEDLACWPSDSKAVGFSKTISAASVNKTVLVRGLADF